MAPAIEVIEMENEGVIASSGNLPGYSDGGEMFSTGGSNRMRNNNYNSASFSDLEDTINDILTFEK